MKKRVLCFLLIALSLPIMVNAKEYCKIVSGTGKDLGDEIACGSEHFYVIDSNQNEIRLLAKYNLYTGYITYEEKVEISDNLTNSEKMEICRNTSTENGGIEIISPSYNNPPAYHYEDTDNPNEINCYYIKAITEEIIKQNELATSAHGGEKGSPEYPQYGDVDLLAPVGRSGTSRDFVFAPGQYAPGSPGFIDLAANSTGKLSNIFNQYNSFFRENGYEVNNIDILSYSDIMDLVNTITGNTLNILPYGEGYTSNIYQHNTLGSIKDVLPEKYSWIYGTTYWLRTMVGSNSGNWGRLLFVDTLGDICYDDYDICSGTTNPLAGIRPVVTIANELQYLISTETDGNGTIEVVESALGNTEIQFKAIAKKGYKLNKLIITTDGGETVEFAEGELTNNSDGTVSIDKNKFTMPFENVTIQARWVTSIINPETGAKLLLVILIPLLVGITIIKTRVRKS